MLLDNIFKGSCVGILVILTVVWEWEKKNTQLSEKQQIPVWENYSLPSESSNVTFTAPINVTT